MAFQVSKGEVDGYGLYAAIVLIGAIAVVWAGIAWVFVLGLAGH